MTSWLGHWSRAASLKATGWVMGHDPWQLSFSFIIHTCTWVHIWITGHFVFLKKCSPGSGKWSPIWKLNQGLFSQMFHPKEQGFCSSHFLLASNPPSWGLPILTKYCGAGTHKWWFRSLGRLRAYAHIANRFKKWHWNGRDGSNQLGCLIAQQKVQTLWNAWWIYKPPTSPLLKTSHPSQRGEYRKLTTGEQVTDVDVWTCSLNPHQRITPSRFSREMVWTHIHCIYIPQSTFYLS